MKLFYEKYIKLAHIGKGANAHVYKVRHAELGYVRAIKILNEDIESKGERAYQSFLKECKTLLAIGNGAHPNIIRIYGPDLIDNHAIVEMDYVQGTTLDSYIKNKGFLDYEEVKIFIHDIVGALAYTHHDIYKFLMNPEEDDLQPDPNDGHKYVITPEKEAELVKKYGIAHNDLHSNNVMRRDYDGSFVLLDFGLAVQDGECIKSSRKSDGHPEYMAPEKFDSGDITPRSDVYSLGVLIYEALTGRPPFVLDYDVDGKVSYPSLSKICNEHHSQTPAPILPLRKEAFERQIPGAVYERDYPEWLDNVVMKCLAKNPDDRYSDAKELIDDINEHILQEGWAQKRGGETKPDPKPVPDPVTPTTGKKKLRLIISSVCLILIAGALCFLLIPPKKTECVDATVTATTKEGAITKDVAVNVSSKSDEDVRQDNHLGSDAKVIESEDKSQKGNDNSNGKIVDKSSDKATYNGTGKVTSNEVTQRNTSTPVTQVPDIPKKPSTLKSEEPAIKYSAPTSINLGYAVWHGASINGKPHGKGKVVFSSRHKVDRHSDVIANPGDYFEAVYENGQLVHGSLFDSTGNKKNTIVP